MDVEGVKTSAGDTTIDGIDGDERRAFQRVTGVGESSDAEALSAFMS